MASLWVVVQWRGDHEAWVAVVCNVDPEPPPLVATDGFSVLGLLLGSDIRGSWLDAGDGKGHRRWGCDVSECCFGPGLHEVELLEVDGPEGRKWKGGGWVGRLVAL